jgi:flagellar hook-associated protein 3 FlgL
MGGWASIYNSTQASLRFQAQDLARLQEMAASGSRVNRPSDAPADAMRILQYRSTANILDNFGKNLQAVTDVREMASAVFTTLNDSMAQARTLIAQGSSGTYSAAQRELDAQVVDSLLEQAVFFANTQEHGQYLFGGSSTEAPYVARRENGRIAGVDYVGGSQNLSPW